MSVELDAAIIAGAVSFVGSVITYIVARATIKAQRQTLEKELQRKLTERLYDLRMKHYPKAFEITDNLGKHSVGTADSLPANFENIRMQLRTWKSAEVTFLLSRRARDAFYDVESRLKKQPGGGKSYNENQLLSIWRARNRFRAALRNDVGLLFGEESDDDA